MYGQPVLFPPISNRETWLQTIQMFDDDTGDLISITDSLGTPMYDVFLEISAPRRHGYSGGGYSQDAWYGDYENPVIFASLADYITLPDTGTIQIQIPYTVMQKLHGNKTYDVFLRLEAVAGDFNFGDLGSDTNDGTPPDARQLLIGRLPVLFGGRGP